MKKQELARELARTTGVTREEAADQVDRLVSGILQELRSGKPANLAGFGRFQLDSEGKIEFRKDSESGKA